MPTLKIDPIATTSRAGFPVTIDGLDPTGPACIVGEVTTPGLGIVRGRWTLTGAAHGQTDDCNIDMDDGELPDLAGLARQLGGDRVD